MYQTIILLHFKRQLKLHTKKYRHLKKAVIKELEQFQKSKHTSLGGNIYKIRIKSKDIPKGKSKSFRLLILVMELEKYLVPITIYFKGDQEEITKKEINNHLETIVLELQLQAD